MVCVPVYVYGLLNCFLIHPAVFIHMCMPPELIQNPINERKQVTTMSPDSPNYTDVNGELLLIPVRAESDIITKARKSNEFDSKGMRNSKQ